MSLLPLPFHCLPLLFLTFLLPLHTPPAESCLVSQSLWEADGQEEQSSQG